MNKAFVILAHSGCGPLHYDLMLQQGRALATWRLEADPADLGEGESIEATKLGAHRVEYLSYEGPVGGGRGEVARSDGGTYRTLVCEPARLRVQLDGKKLSGRYELTQTRQASDEWTLKRLPDG